jgi:hypothetical protein
MLNKFSFQLNLINSCLQFVTNIGSWFLSGCFGCRTNYLWGTAFNFTMLILLGVCTSIKQNVSINYAQACLSVIISFVYAGTLRPISYSIIAETSSVRLRALSTGVGRGRLLYRRGSHDLPSLKDAEPDRVESRRQVRLRLGRYRCRLLGYGLLSPS